MPRNTGAIWEQYGHIAQLLHECSDPALQGVGRLWSESSAGFARVINSMLDEMETEKIIFKGEMPAIEVAAIYHHVKRGVFDSSSSADKGLLHAHFAYPVLVLSKHKLKVGKQGRVPTGDLVIFEDKEIVELDLTTATFSWAGRPGAQHDGTKIIKFDVSSAIYRVCVPYYVSVSGSRNLW